MAGPGSRDTLQRILLDHYARDPERLYVRCVLPGGRDERVTYRGLAERGSQLAGVMADLGARPADVVIVVLPHSADLFCAFFGAILGGQVPAILSVPSFKLDAAYYRHEIEGLLARIEAAVLVTDTETAARLEVEGDTIGRARVLLADRLAPASAPIPEPSARPEDVVLLQHSSGSTGLKKGVALSNRAILDQVNAYRDAIALDPADRIASWLPLYHDMGLIACTVIPALAGVPVSALGPLHWVTSPASLLRLIHEDRCTLAWMPNFAYEFLATRVRKSQIGDARLDSMRAWINCSEPTFAQSHRRFLERFAPLGVRAETLWTCYAAAETTFAISQSTAAFPARVERLDRERFLAGGEAVPTGDAATPAMELLSGGRLLAGTSVRIVDEAGNELGERRVGEIAIRSGSLFSGYLKDPESTARALRDGWYLSGDLGFIADGHLFITGRKKDLIIIAGRNYYPQDIERIVSDVEGIYTGRVVALGVDDPALGTQRLVVLAEVADPALVDSPELAGEVRAAVSAHLDCAIDDLRLLPHMSLLKTSSGKIARAPNLARFVGSGATAPASS
jgi:acyl-CoA synthetase (AMP-forming)/AMP-acid ligase II